MTSSDLSGPTPRTRRRGGLATTLAVGALGGAMLGVLFSLSLLCVGSH